MMPSAGTRCFALLGDPVAHSLSPRFQNAAFRAAGIDAVYVALRCRGEEIAPAMALLAANGGGGNVTVPHKGVAASTGQGSPRVRTLGVANVFAGRDGALLLDNTDVTGVLHALDRIEASGTAWLLVGTGGSARAVVGAAAERGATLAIQSRSPDNAAALGALAASLGVALVEPADCTVAINATPLGLKSGDPLPLDPRGMPHLRWALDLVYRSDGSTLWVDTCRAAGLRAEDGREMLIAQGAASWDLWFPGVRPSLEVMRAALR